MTASTDILAPPLEQRVTELLHYFRTMECTPWIKSVNADALTMTAAMLDIIGEQHALLTREAAPQEEREPMPSVAKLRELADAVATDKTPLDSCYSTDMVNFLLTAAQRNTSRTEMSDYRVRAMDEFRELQQRIEKLKAFIVGASYDGLPEVDRTDLKEQLQHMEAYQSVLGRRVSRLCNNA